MARHDTSKMLTPEVPEIMVMMTKTSWKCIKLVLKSCCWDTSKMLAPAVFNRKDIKIKTKPKMIRVRENNWEFGHCSEVKSVFMRALRPYFVRIRGRRIHYEMVSMFTQVRNQDAILSREERNVEAGLASADGSMSLS